MSNVIRGQFGAATAVATLAVLSLAGLAPTASAQPGFNGPSILVRGVRPFGPGSGRPIPIRAHMAINTGYSTGLGLPGTDTVGAVPNQDSLISTLSFGVSGTRTGQRSSLTTSYGGAYTLFSDQQFYSGLSQALTIGYQRSLSRRWTFDVGASGRQQNSVLNSVLVAEPVDTIAPVTDLTAEVFDNTIVQAGLNAAASYQHSGRLAFSMTGGTFTVQRRSNALASGWSYGGGAEMRYSLSRRTTVSTTFQHVEMQFQRGLGESRVNQVMGQISYVLSRAWSASGGAGVYFTDSRRVAAVAVDPLIAQLTGIRTALEVLDRHDRGLAAQLSLTGRYGNRVLSLAYSRGIAPGNGVLLTSTQDSILASASWRTTSRLGLSAVAQAVKMNQILGFTASGASPEAKAIRGSVALSYRISPWLHFTSSCQTQRVDLGAFQRTRIAFLAGIAVRSGEFPLSLF